MQYSTYTLPSYLFPPTPATRPPCETWSAKMRWRLENFGVLLQRESVSVFENCTYLTRDGMAKKSKRWVKSTWRQNHLSLNQVANPRLSPFSPRPPSFSKFLPLIDGESGIHNRPTKEELKKKTHPRLWNGRCVLRSPFADLKLQSGYLL
jgi:hypothetical protein